MVASTSTLLCGPPGLTLGNHGEAPNDSPHTPGGDSDQALRAPAPRRACRRHAVGVAQATGRGVQTCNNTGAR